MAFELTGKLIEKYDVVQVSDRFRKREFVIVLTSERSGMEYTDFAKFQLTQDRCDLIDPYNINDEIKVSFDISGNKWEKDGRVSYFTNRRAWKIEPAGEGQQASAPDPFAEGAADNLTPPPEPGPEDDLPF
jgi:hypothetical protein